MSATPLDTASKTSNGLTISPAANTFTCRRLPVTVVIAPAIRSALACKPGRPFGQLVTILNSRMPCESAGVGNVADAAPTDAAYRNFRRFITLLPGLQWPGGRQRRGVATPANHLLPSRGRP